MSADTKIERDILTVIYERLNPCLSLDKCFAGPSNAKYSCLCESFRTMLDNYFECTARGSSVDREISSGVVHFFACLYILPVMPQQMSGAGYDINNSYAAVAFISGIGSIVSGIFTNLPLIIAPPTALTIFLVSKMRESQMSVIDGNAAVVYSGIAILLIGIIGPVGRLTAKFIPECIQASTAVGIGLITAFAGATEIGLVEQGEFTVLQVGDINDEIMVALSALAFLAFAMTRKSNFSYLIGLLWGALIWWTSQRTWPDIWGGTPEFKSSKLVSADSDTTYLTFSILFIAILTLYGLAQALCDIAKLNPEDGSIPNGRLLVVIVGLCSIISGLLYGPPIVVSPESAGAIKAGAKTGISAIICGLLFLFSVFFGPFFLSIPAAGTSPVLITIGLILFMNIKRIDFSQTKDAFPAFLCLVFIPFTNSIIVGAGLGYAMYVVISVFNLEIFQNWKSLVDYYFPTDSDRLSLSSAADKPDDSMKDGQHGSGIASGAITTKNMRRASAAFIQSVVSNDTNLENKFSAAVL